MTSFFAFSLQFLSSTVGYGKQYMSFDSRFRKLANEAIYPFCLLHQPVILIMGFFLINPGIPDLVRFIFLFISSFGITCLLYWFVVRPLNMTRVIFGMKPVARRKLQDSVPENMELIPQVVVERQGS